MKTENPSLEEIFAALADPARREMVLRLSRTGSMTTGALTGGLAISRQAAERHLKVLEQSGLVLTTKKGRERIRSLDASRLRMVQEWMKSLELAWSERLWRLRESYE